MKSQKSKNLLSEINELKARLSEAEELISAIKSGAVDAFVTDDRRVFTLKDSDSAYRILIETINEGAATLTCDGTIMYCNKRLADMFLWPLEKIIGVSILDFAVPGEIKKLESFIIQSKSHTSRAEFQFKRNGYPAITAYVSCNSLETDTRGLCMVITDLTEQKKAEIAMERAKRLSEIGLLAATVAHELRNPLASIGMAAHNIRRKSKSPDFDRHLATIDKKISESDQIIDNLLFYSRLRPPDFKKINILDVLEESVASSDNMDRMAIPIIRKTSLLKDIYVSADSVQVKEVFVNILNNARDAVPEDAGEIRINSEIDDEYITISFHDNGSGIRRDIRDRIFDPFFSTKARGTGLGLAVCKQIITMHGGEINVKEGFTGGTCIVVRLSRNEKK